MFNGLIETMSLQMMLDEITTQINKRSSKHDCKPKHPDRALENFKAEQTEITVFFLNGFQMKGVIEDFDKYMISLVSQGKQHLIYKHASDFHCGYRIY